MSKVIPTERKQALGALAARGLCGVERACLRRIDLAWLAAFRVLFGLTLAVSMLRFVAYGWVERLFVQPRFHFKYWGFHWVEPLSGPAMHTLFLVLAALAFAMAAGAAFRLCAPLFALGLSYVQLIDVSTYLNHYYLAALLAWMLAFSPAHRTASVDAWVLGKLRRDGQHVPRRSQGVAAGWLYLFRMQVAVVYVFAGLAKLQTDWLLHAQPLGIWLGASTDLPLLGPLLTLEGVPLLFSWCGFLFDTTIVLWLSWPRTRAPAYVLLLAFHVLTRLLFPIGMFPWIMTLSALVFFDPDWPRRCAAWLSRLRRTPGADKAPRAVVQAHPEARPSTRRLALALGGVYCLVQLLLPMRSVLYGGNVLWHEQGLRFSWRVMLRAKGGSTTFIVRNKRSGEVWHIAPGVYLTPLQESEMSSQPDLILQLAHHIHADLARQGRGPVEVFAETRVALNGRRAVPLIDASVDLVAVRDGLAPASWVLPAPAAAPPHTRPLL